jgi:hypothetical protein
MRAFWRLAGRLLLSLALGVGWLAFLAIVLLWVGEKSGWLAVLVRDALASAAGSFGADLEVDRAELDWFGLGLALDGVRLGSDGDALELEKVELDFRLTDGGGVRLERVDLAGGHLRLSPWLWHGFEGFSSRISRSGAVADRSQGAPVLTVRGLQVDVDSARLGRVPIGLVDLSLARDADRNTILSGHLLPNLAGSQASSGEVFLEGRQLADGGLELRARGRELPISTAYLPPDTELEFLRAWKPSGRLAIEAEALLHLDGRSSSRGTARIVLADGSLLAGGTHPLGEMRVETEIELSSPAGGALRDPDAWRARAEGSGRFRATPVRAVARFGREPDSEDLAQLSLHAPEVTLGRELLELFGDTPANRVRWNAFDARGKAELAVGARLHADYRLGEPLAGSVGLGFEVGFAGEGGLTYHGWPSERGTLDLGFPLPVDGARGSLVFAFDPRRTRPALLGLVGLSGESANGPIECYGTIASHPVDAPRDAPGRGAPEIDLHLASPRLAIDENVHQALTGLSGVIAEKELWDAYHPAGGSASIDLRLFRSVDMELVSTTLEVGLEDVGLSWTDLPMPLSRARGTVRFASDGHREYGLGLALTAGLRSAQNLVLAVRRQSDPRARRGDSRFGDVHLLDVSVTRMSLSGDDKQILVGRYPVIGSAMDEMQPRGFADVEYRRVQHAPGAPLRTTSEVSAREVQIQPRQFQMITTGVRGRVLVDALEPTVVETPAPVGNGTPPAPVERVDTRLMPLVGTWGQDVQVAFFADFTEDRVQIFGAGVDPTNKGLLGALGQAVQTPDTGGEVDMTALGARGPVDFTGVIELAREPEAETRKTGRLFLRGNTLESGDLKLGELRGVLDWNDDVIRGERLSARLADTPVELRELSFSTSTQGYRLDTRIDAENLPLDRAHLRSFMDASTLDALLGELHWRGRVDIEGGRLTLTGPRQGEGRLEFRGTVIPNDMFVQLGLPLSIRSATAIIDELILEGGRVRGVGRIEDLFGRIADRELGPARLLVTYVEPRLSIEDVSGELEGGRLLPLGGTAERGGTAFSIDLEEPFPFQLALELRDVEVAGLLRGLFPSNVSTRGRLSCALRLVGNTENLLGIEGSGSFLIEETRMWSVPVFRALFSQLGFDDTAVFDRMATNVRVRDGVVEMNDIAVHSPLLQLVGEGKLDFDGSLDHELEVRYALVDRLGPFTRLLYSIQNKLLSVAIRGDMSRPEVVLRNPLSAIFGLGGRERALPLPAYTPLPPRF